MSRISPLGPESPRNFGDYEKLVGGPSKPFQEPTPDWGPRSWRHAGEKLEQLFTKNVTENVADLLRGIKESRFGNIPGAKPPKTYLDELIDILKEAKGVISNIDPAPTGKIGDTFAELKRNVDSYLNLFENMKKQLADADRSGGSEEVRKTVDSFLSKFPNIEHDLIDPSGNIHTDIELIRKLS